MLLESADCQTDSGKEWARTKAKRGKRLCKNSFVLFLEASFYGQCGGIYGEACPEECLQVRPVAYNFAIKITEEVLTCRQSSVSL